MILDVLVVDGRLNAGTSSHEVIHANVGASQELRIHIHKSHGLTEGVRWEGRGPATVGGRLEHLTGLAFTHRHHKRLVHHDLEIGAGVANGKFAQLDEVRFSQVISCLASLNLENSGSCISIGQRNVDTLLESTSDSVI